MFAVYMAGGARQPPLSISPMDDGQSAQAVVELIESILKVYSKQPANVKFVVADN